MAETGLPPLEDPAVNANHILAWLSEKPPSSRVDLAQAVFDILLQDAARPRSTSTQACTRLCGFVQQCMKSDQTPLRNWAFSEETSLKLFDFYLEWNEKDQHRSMKLVLDLLTASMGRNPEPGVADSLKHHVLESLVSIISRQSTRPLVKSAISSLNHLVVKDVLSLDDVGGSYRKLAPGAACLSSFTMWRSFISEMFRWMDLSHVWPVAGKFLVTLFKGLQGRQLETDQGAPTVVTVSTIHAWLQEALANNPDLLESIKNYILNPLFRSDRGLSLELLESLNRIKPLGSGGNDFDTAALLQLAALDAGKKCALVEDPSPTGIAPSSHAVVLKEEVLEDVLTHPSREVRSLAMSLLITSSASTRPYAPVAMQLLQKHLAACHSDHDAKFRNEILGHSKDMVKRVKAVMTLLRRQLSHAQNGASLFDEGGINQTTNGGATAPRKAGKAAKKLSAADIDSARETLHQHEAFFCWYLQFLKSELVPTASYQRHITALRALLPVMKLEKQIVGHEALDLETAAFIFSDYSWLRCILDRVMDPFDDVRETAVAMLMMFPPDAIRIDIEIGPELPRARLINILREFCGRASKLASRTARADHADGAARSYGLLCSWTESHEARFTLLSQVLDTLEKKISMAEKELGRAAIEEPVHGDFAALSYIWQVLTKRKYESAELEVLIGFQRRIFLACDRIWNAVSHVLCDDSPEGHLPEEMEDVDGLDTKDLLSYSFRSIHESSNLMRTVVSTLRQSRAVGILLPSQEVFKAVGTLTFNQLSTLRHRGAFSTVSLTFTTCCQVAMDPHVNRATDQEASPLLDIWYKGTLQCIFDQASTTRRSAGIPALMTGILASNAPRPSFSEVMKMLQDIARKPALVAETDGSNLPQVHAFNCIKEVFKSSLLNKKAEVRLPECLQLAISSLRSEVWAIRNCALLLLRSLIDCLFGTGESKSSMEAGWDGKTLRLSYTKHPMLPGLLVDLLRSGEQAMQTSTQNSAAESVFPALEIIRRGGPPDEYRDALYDLIAEYLGSHLWHVREIAARTLCSFLLHGDFILPIQKLLDGSKASANRLHGVLLVVKFLLERKSEVADDPIYDDVTTLMSVLKALRWDSQLFSCPEVLAAYVEVLNLSLKLVPTALAECGISYESTIQTSGERPKDSLVAPSALLRDRLALRDIQVAAISWDLRTIQTTVYRALENDVNTACLVLEDVPRVWGTKDASGLSQLYMQVAARTQVPELRALALTNLAHVLYGFVETRQVDNLPSPEELCVLKESLGNGYITPSLSQAIITFTGAMMAAEVAICTPETKAATDQHLREWGKMMSEAMGDSNTFDMRFAAVSAVKSFTATARAIWTEPACLPLILTLYDAMNDDDDEIRDIAALAAAVILGQSLVPLEASSALLDWTARTFGHLHEFRWYVVARMTGNSTVRATPAQTTGYDSAPLGGPSPARLFKEALRVDDELFAVEEQNLWVDEVRETQRWAGVFEATTDWDGSDNGLLAGLRKWAGEALDALLDTLRREDDGPLGWSSKPEAFALCTRAVLCGRAVAEKTGEESLRAALDGVRDAGRRSRFHGLLLDML
ncbi:tRNA (Cytidine(32)-2'-O)-methyltransferase non-catalytic subunit TRM732 [Pleurostoma richardsiae]|uniref:tRNA (Cytidine(32)-2'-O)-methyltransferase non-catalytic subunit TRM732 n=1 Tax=Pleurostoma richardsiae TaxID=41990 RepID=A0AA38SAD4_9PEZI|nr:tRNA (Cytidine(32)-2'-O)-methyltransferase non-catalytic subunit TRM732 [Pleurostoma richardsiae]